MHCMCAFVCVFLYVLERYLFDNTHAFCVCVCVCVCVCLQPYTPLPGEASLPEDAEELLVSDQSDVYRHALLTLLM